MQFFLLIFSPIFSCPFFSTKVSATITECGICGNGKDSDTDCSNCCTGNKSCTMPVVIAARTSLRTLLQINVNPSVPLDRVVMAIRDNIAVTEKMVQIIKL